MNDASIVYTVNLIIGAILAGVMSRHWRLEAGNGSLRHWIVAAWTLTAADLLFVLRATSPDVVPRMLPTLMVTAGHATLLLAAQRSTGRAASAPGAVGIVAVHAVLLLGYFLMPEYAAWRTVANGIIWGGLSIVAARTLWQSSPPLRRVLLLPALVLGAQGAFHAVRSALATRSVVQPDTGYGSLVQLLGDLEVSLFMVALFVGVLVAFLELSNRELRIAVENVRQLSTMLPLCSWCNKVRDDDGYWTRIEEYLAEHKVSVTHALCENCAAKHFEPKPVP